MLHLIQNFSIKNHEKKEKTVKKRLWWINPPLSGETHPARKISVAAACQVCTSLKVSTRSTSALEAGEMGEPWRTPGNKMVGARTKDIVGHFAPPNLVTPQIHHPTRLSRYQPRYRIAVNQVVHFLRLNRWLRRLRFPPFYIANWQPRLTKYNPVNHHVDGFKPSSNLALSKF